MSATSSPRRIARLAVPVLALVILAAAVPAISSALTLKLPLGVTKRQAFTMYAEQLDSQAAIRDLAGGRISQFVIVKRSSTASTAALSLEVTYKNGLKRRGIMRLFKAGDAWYLRSISRGKSVERMGYRRVADIGVVNTVLLEQTENAAISANFVNGTYKRITIGTPKPGYRSTELPVTFAGTSKSEKGRVTLISKTVDGRRIWFITGFAK